MCIFSALAWGFKLSGATARPLFFSLILVLPWIPSPVPAAFLLWTGPVVYVVWLAVVSGMLMAKGRSPSASYISRPRTSLALAAAVAFAAYVASAWWLAAILPGGDEPHYLVITQSLLRDADIQVENNYSDGQYREFFPESLNSHAVVRGVNGQQYSVHAPGLPMVVAPAFALGGYPGVVVFLALIAAAGGALLWWFSHRLTGSSEAAWFAWAAGVLSAPFFFQAFSVYPDGLSATLVLFACLPLFERDVNRTTWFAIGAALSLMPWLHTRLVVVAAVLGLVLLLRLWGAVDRRLRIAAFLAIPIAAALGWAAFFVVVYGRFDPSAPYGGETQTHISEIWTGLPALFFDHQFGLLPNAPVYAFCLAGLAVLARDRPRLAAELAAISGSYIVAVSAFHMWWAGASAPARFLAPVLPLMAIPAAWLWTRTPHLATRAAGVAAVLVSVMTTILLVVVDRGFTAFNVRDGYGRGAEWINSVVDVALGLPSFFRNSSAEALLRAAIWIVAIAAAVFALRVLEKARARRATVALATPLVLAAAIMCALTAVWSVDGVAAPNPEKSQMSVLERYDSRWRPLGFTMSPLRTLDAQSVLPKIMVATPARRGRAASGTLLLAPEIVPGGEYELRLADPSASGTARLVIGRRARPIQTWNLDGDFGEGAARIQLPVNVGSLVVLGEQSAPVGAITLHPLKVWQGPSKISGEIARRVERYGPALVSFFDLSAMFPEPAGFWIAGRRDTRFAVGAVERGRFLQMFLRNAAVDNRVHVSVDGASQVLDLRAREERTLPVLIGPDRPGALIEIASETGFRPADVEPGSTDPRFLGVWVEFR